MSKHDLESGTRWGQQLADQLETSNFGILCLTPSNLNNPWILFEAGSLTKIANSRACGLLFGGVSPADIAGPLSQFQHRIFDQEGVFTLLEDLNRVCESPLEQSQLKLLYDKFWPDLQQECAEVFRRPATDDSELPKRDTSEVLNELVTAVRDLERRIEGIARSRGPLQLDGFVHQTLAGLDDNHLAPLPYLVTVSGARTPGDYTELSRDYTSKVIDDLIATGLLRRSVRDDRDIVEVAHDALVGPIMSHFPRIFQRQNKEGT